MKILLTGAAGFIGMHAALRLLQRGDEVVGIDNITPYYEVSLKRARLAQLAAYPNFRFIEQDLADLAGVQAALGDWKPQRVLHLAAQPGVRYSIDHPHTYAQANLVAFLNVLELCRHWQVEHLAYASSSSVYGANAKLPFSEDHSVDHPVSLYAATKKANELMAHTYSHLYQLPTSGLRFFTVYGPWGRPDMAPFKFVKAITEGQGIDIYNYGRQMRDFTYVDDIVESTLRVLDKPATPDADFDRQQPRSSTSFAPYRVFNIGNADPVQLMDFVGTIEQAVGHEADKRMLPAQPGDVEATFADTSALRDWIGFQPATPLKEGVARFVDWYRGYYGH
ncbi:MAG: NAD-dependent epimerase [Burkholderiales bacterium]|nr:NAD-dependent epimerase [Burkholderiales bacterium]